MDSHTPIDKIRYLYGIFKENKCDEIDQVDIFKQIVVNSTNIDKNTTAEEKFNILNIMHEMKYIILKLFYLDKSDLKGDVEVNVTLKILKKMKDWNLEKSLINIAEFENIIKNLKYIDSHFSNSIFLEYNKLFDILIPFFENRYIYLASKGY